MRGAGAGSSDAMATVFAWEGYRDDEGGSGPSRVWSTRGPIGNAAHRNGSFAEDKTWKPMTSDSRFSLTLVGDATRGPVIVSTSTPPGAECFAATTLPTEVFRVVVRGSCRSEAGEFVAGDAQVQAADVPWVSAFASDDGVDELILLGDRRFLAAGVPPEWSEAFGMQQLNAAATST
jgi:hypothetical protein